ncbi:MAG: GTPase [Candidatus Latescibacteria bacterium]|nr:GTPase [Candidatus Latescibacterota bacterium]NIM20987.1 GTPase [Candidatus Latescibacterota bacterium]NIM65122.1 GTPase [Candidatus Latescibacterota bacterium]NIO01637.1 GTPase [Candidatus Latescibacterota bacterium]NIO28154.1 GTPase [Candidatus Latescibacterota bacterium]
MARERILIMGAAGRDFHNFNVLYRNNKNIEVVAFTATQIPDIEGRSYPPVLAGDLYPGGIPIIAENSLREYLVHEKVDTAVFSYSDVSYEYVMQKAARINSLGVDFLLLGSKEAMIPSIKPVIAVCAVRTGSGKSQTTRRVAEMLRKRGYRVAVVRHPMPYGDLTKQVVQRFATLEDLDLHDCTIEEREEYEPHIINGNIVFAGVDYAQILKEAETESDVVLWDGGNNDLPFYRPNLWIVMADPHRPGHELRYYPGEINLYEADVVVINKMDTAAEENVNKVLENIKSRNPSATIIRANSPITVDGDASQIKGKRVLCIEDGPTLTHGEMKYGAGVVAARQFGASEIIDPRPFAVGKIKATFAKYPEIGDLLPAMGYGSEQVQDLEKTIEASDAELVLIGTPIDLSRVIRIDKPCLRVRYHLEEVGSPTLEDVLNDFEKKFRALGKE